jgi:hypothetical protein
MQDGGIARARGRFDDWVNRYRDLWTLVWTPPKGSLLETTPSTVTAVVVLDPRTERCAPAGLP